MRSTHVTLSAEEEGHTVTAGMSLIGHQGFQEV